MACSDHGIRITSIAHGATSLGSPVGGSIVSTVSFKEGYPSTRIAPSTCVDTLSIRATGTFRDLTTPIAIGTKATLTYTLQQKDLSTMTAALANAVMGGTTFDFNGQFHEETYEFAYDSGDSDTTNPITVAG